MIIFQEINATHEHYGITDVPREWYQVSFIDESHKIHFGFYGFFTHQTFSITKRKELIELGAKKLNINISNIIAISYLGQMPEKDVF